MFYASSLVFCLFLLISSSFAYQLQNYFYTEINDRAHACEGQPSFIIQDTSPYSLNNILNILSCPKYCKADSAKQFRSKSCVAVLKPLFLGNYVEMRIATASRPCSEIDINSASLFGWVMEGVCVSTTTIGKSAYEAPQDASSQIKYNSDSITVKLNCQSTDCDSNCEISTVIPKSALRGDGAACIPIPNNQILLLQLVQGKVPGLNEPTTLSLVSEYYDQSNCVGTPSRVETEINSQAICVTTCQSTATKSVRTFCK